MSDQSVLIDANQLHQLLANQNAEKHRTNKLIDALVLLDCRHDLLNHNAGRAAFDTGHIPGAQFWNMETDATAKHTGLNGRHPLASREQTRACFETFGLSNESILVVYDAHGGQYAGRLWWLARWIGHQHVRLLDGGLQAWQSAGFDLAEPHQVKPNQVEFDNRSKKPLSLKPSLVGWVDKLQVALTSQSSSSRVLDARAAARFRGETEPLDPVAGHIPGAINRFYQNNLDSQGFFKSKAVLKTEFEAILGELNPPEIIHQCGSGVTACHNLIAMEVAGLHGSVLYPGSWSEWCADASLPVATGD
jgi:thiosulfate/3-mercaptopyruvate sulfurtransferase